MYLSFLKRKSFERMASQNVDPTRVNSSTRKQKNKSDVLSGGLHTVTQRSVEN